MTYVVLNYFITNQQRKRKGEIQLLIGVDAKPINVEHPSSLPLVSPRVAGKQNEKGWTVTVT